jgi:hypothetical protein
MKEALMEFGEIFTEQAEFLSTKNLVNWSADHPKEGLILKKLSGPGSHLITGPRGCGKTTLLLKAYQKTIKNKQSGTFPVYVNYKLSLKLEPLYSGTTNAVYWFNQWLIAKIYEGLYVSMKEAKINKQINLKVSESVIKAFISKLEFGATEFSALDDHTLDSSHLEDDISDILKLTDKKRCVLLLDDAAHAFSPQQQRDFFDFFRKIRSRCISPKAAIYPGVTSLSPSFHLGHDAEEIDIWLRPDEKGYIDFMIGLLKKRLPTEVYEKLIEKEVLLQLIAYASFGIPRATLNIVKMLYDENLENGEVFLDYDQRNVRKQIKKSFEETYSIFRSLQNKLPIYKKFIDSGEGVFNKIVNQIKEFNKDKAPSRQALEVLIKSPLEPEFEKLVGFFKYAGLLMPKGTIAKGDKGVFSIFSVHYGALIDRNAIIGKSSFNVNDYVEAFTIRPHNVFPRLTTDKLVQGGNVKESLQLSLPPCSSCNSPRQNVDAKFCMNCGAPLKNASIFDSLVNQDIEELPITINRAQSIKQHSKIKTIKDVLIDIEKRELRKVPQIGEVWATRITAYAEEFIA